MSCCLLDCFVKYKSDPHWVLGHTGKDTFDQRSTSHERGDVLLCPACVLLAGDQPAMNVVTSFCVLLACFLPVNALTLTACKDGQIDIVHGTQASIKCTGLASNRNYYWSITTPTTGAEMTIGTCLSRYSIPCQRFNVSDTDYNITRGPTSVGDVSTVSFVANETDHHNTTIRCALFYSPPGVTCRINVIEVHRLSGCFVEENAQTPISCSYREPSHGMYWSIIYLNGTYSTVAECAPCVNNPCPACDVNNTDFRVTRDQHSSVIKMVSGRDVDKDGAKLQCSRSDNVTADHCTVTVFYLKLPQCEGGQLDVSEVEPWTTVNCEGLRQLQNMNWTITDLTGNRSQIAFCDSKKNCTTDSSDVKVSRENQYSNMTFVGHVREKANLILTCIKRDGRSHDSCRIRTFYPAETNNVTVRVDSNFTVTGRVYIDKVYASDNNITCQWFHAVDNKTGDELLTNLSLSTFTYMDGLEYQRGHCDMTLPVNSFEITHYFGVLIQPSNKSIQVDGVVIIDKPGQNLTTTCPDYVSEGSDLTCECSHFTAEHGNPPATISWRDVNDTAGLHIRNVSRNMNGSEYVCSSVWGEGRPEDVYYSHNYTMLVAYGPNVATVYASGDGNDDPNTVTLTCTYDVAYPSVNFSWDVACVTFTLTPDSSTCTIDMGMLHVREAVCTASNTEFPALNAKRQHTFLLDVAGPPFPLVGVVVGVVAAVLLVIIIVVVVVIIAKRRGRTKGIVGTPESSSATPDPPDDGYEVPVGRTPGADGGQVADRSPTLPTVPESNLERTSSTEKYIEFIAGEPSSDTEGAPYDSLQMSDVNVPSVYSEITRSTNESAESYDTRTSSTEEYIEMIDGEPSSDTEGAPYSSLQMSDVNVPSVYCEITRSTNESAESDDTPYANMSR